MVNRYEVKVAFTQEFSVEVYADSEEEAAAYFESRGGIQSSDELLASEGRYQIGAVTLDDETVAVGNIDMCEEAYPEVTEARVLITWEQVLGDDPEGGEYTNEQVALCERICGEVQKRLAKMFPYADKVWVYTDRLEYAQAHTMIYFTEGTDISRQDAANLAANDLVEEVVTRRVADYEQDLAWIRENGEPTAEGKLLRVLEELGL